MFQTFYYHSFLTCIFAHYLRAEKNMGRAGYNTFHWCAHNAPPSSLEVIDWVPPLICMHSVCLSYVYYSYNGFYVYWTREVDTDEIYWRPRILLTRFFLWLESRRPGGCCKTTLSPSPYALFCTRYSSQMWINLAAIVGTSKPIFRYKAPR